MPGFNAILFFLLFIFKTDGYENLLAYIWLFLMALVSESYQCKY